MLMPPATMVLDSYRIKATDSETIRRYARPKLNTKIPNTVYLSFLTTFDVSKPHQSLIFFL